MAPHSSTLAWKIPWMEEPGGLQSIGSLRGGHDLVISLSCIGEGNGNPLQCSCLENPRDREAWWAAVYGVAQSRTQLKRRSSRREAFPPSVAELHLGDIKESRGHEPSMYFCYEKNFLSEAVMVSKEFGKSLKDSQQEQQVHLQNRRGPGTGAPRRHSTGTLESCSCHNSHLLDLLASSCSLPPLHHHPNVLQCSSDTTWGQHGVPRQPTLLPGQL